MSNETLSNETMKKKSSPIKLAIAIVAATGSLSLVAYQYYHFRQTSVHSHSGHHAHARRYFKTVDGRELLWARGPHEGEGGEWFDVTDSPLDAKGYQFGIGKDSISSIDNPQFVVIDRREELLEYGIRDDTSIIGYVHNDEAKAYPVAIMSRHELVNDFVGGKPVTVGW